MVQVHRYRKRVARHREDVARKPVDFGNVACLEARKPGVQKRLHALAARTDTRARKRIDVVLALRVARHLGKHLRFDRWFEFVFSGKPATVVNFEPAGIKPHFGEEPAFELFAVFYTAHAVHVGGRIAEERFGMQVLASLVDFIHHAQQRRRREGELLHLIAGRSDRGLVQDKPAVTEGLQKRRTEITEGSAHGNHELRRIRFDIKLAFNGHYGCNRVKRTYPLEFLLTAALVAGSRLRNKFVYDFHVAHIGHHRYAHRIVFCTGLNADYRTVVVKLQGRYLGSVVIVKEVTTPMFWPPGRSKETRVKNKSAAHGIDSQRPDGICHRIKYEHRVGIIAGRNIRVAFATHVHLASKHIALLGSEQGNLCLRGIIKR